MPAGQSVVGVVTFADAPDVAAVPSADRALALRGNRQGRAGLQRRPLSRCLECSGAGVLAADHGAVVMVTNLQETEFQECQRPGRHARNRRELKSPTWVHRRRTSRSRLFASTPIASSPRCAIQAVRRATRAPTWFSMAVRLATQTSRWQPEARPT